MINTINVHMMCESTEDQHNQWSHGLEVTEDQHHQWSHDLEVN